MCWTDRVATENIIKLKDCFGLDLAVETGSYFGINVELLAHYFKWVVGIEIDEHFHNNAVERLKPYHNTKSWLASSEDIIAKLNPDIPTYFYLDSHPHNRSETDWKLLDELKAIGRRDNCVICVHDFNNGELGYSTVGKQVLDWDYIKEDIRAVNSDFHYYTNTKEMCDIITNETVRLLPIQMSAEINRVIKQDIYGSGDFSKYRGILYAVPGKLDLKEFSVVDFDAD